MRERQLQAPPIPEPAAFDPKQLKSYGAWNGHAWLLFTDVQRLIYVDTARETVQWVAHDKLSAYFAETVTVGQIAEDITGFYASEENRWVPIHFALWAARLEAGGANSEKLKGFVSTLKKTIEANTIRSPQ